MEEIKEKIRSYVQENFLDEESKDQIDDSTKLISSGIIDSISTLQLVDKLEEWYSISIEAHEVDQDNLDTIELITQFIQSKLAN